MKHFIRIFCVVLVLFATSISVFADELDDKISDVEEQLKTEKNVIAALYDESGQNELEALDSQITDINKKLTTQKKNLVDIQKNKESAVNNLLSTDNDANSRLRASYKTNIFGLIDIVLSSENIDELLSNISMSTYVYKHDRELIEELETVVEDWNKKESSKQKEIDELNDKKKEIEDKVASIHDKTTDLEDKIKASEDKIIELDNQLQELTKEYNELHGIKEPYIHHVHEFSYGGLDAAYRLIGTPYVWGGSSPAGTDCSGLVWQTYGHARGRTTYNMIASLKASGDWVTNIKNLKYGDLVFPHEGHVGIYLGDNQMLHAPHPGTSVQISKVYGFYGGGPY